MVVNYSDRVLDKVSCETLVDMLRISALDGVRENKAGIRKIEGTLRKQEFGKLAEGYRFLIRKADESRKEGDYREARKTEIVADRYSKSVLGFSSPYSRNSNLFTEEPSMSTSS